MPHQDPTREAIGETVLTAPGPGDDDEMRDAFVEHNFPPVKLAWLDGTFTIFDRGYIF